MHVNPHASNSLNARPELSWDDGRFESLGLGSAAVKTLLPGGIEDIIENSENAWDRISGNIDPWSPDTQAVVLTVSDGVLASARFLEDERLNGALHRNSGTVVAMYTPGNPRMRDIADGLVTYTKNRGLNIELRPLPNAIDINGYKEAYAAALHDYPRSVLNGTGGIGAMRDAALAVFREANRPIIQLNPSTREVIHIFGKKGIVGRDFLQGQPSIKDMLTLDGLTVIEDKTDDQRQYGDDQLDRIVSAVKDDAGLFWRLQTAINDKGKPLPDEFMDLPPVVGGAWLPEYIKKQIDKHLRSGFVSESAREVVVYSRGPRKGVIERYDIDVACQVLGRPVIMEAKAVGPTRVGEEIQETVRRIKLRDIAGRKGPVHAIVLSAPIAMTKQNLGFASKYGASSETKTRAMSATSVLSRALGEADRNGIVVLSTIDFLDTKIEKTLQKLARMYTP